MKKLLTLAALAGLLCACSQTQEEEKESVDVAGLQEAIAFPAVPAEAVSFTITSNVAWSIQKTGLDWLTIDPMRGNADKAAKTVTLTAAENKDDQPRSGSFTLKAGSYSKTVTVNQAEAAIVPTFSVSGLEDNTLSFASDETAGKTFTVASNKDWQATPSSLDWADVSPLEGRKDRSATITVTPKTANTGSTREGSLSFNYGAATPIVIRIVQNGFVPTISLSATDILVAADGSAEVSSVTVTANGNWTAAPGADWISLDKTSGPAGETLVKLSFVANDKTEDRSAAVVFDNGGAKAELLVRQGAKTNETLEVSPSSLSFGNGGGSASVTVESNASWTASSAEDWLTVSPASGSGNVSLTITAAANEGDERTGTVTVAVSATLKQTVTVSQAASGSVASFIDLSTPLVWRCNNQRWNIDRSPDYATAGQNGGKEGEGTGAGTGIVYPDREDNLAYAQHVQGDNEFSGTYVTNFILAAEGHITWKPSWTNDAMVFHIPVKSIKAGQTLYFDYAIRGTTACPRNWVSEVNIDGTWERMDTGLSEDVLKDGESVGIANSQATAANTAFSYEGKYVVNSDVSFREIQLRIRCVFGGIGVGGKSYSGIQSNGTLRLCEGDIDGAPFVGPTVYVK